MKTNIEKRKRFEKHISKENIQRINKHLKKLKKLAINEKQLKITIK